MIKKLQKTNVSIKLGLMQLYSAICGIFCKQIKKSFVFEDWSHFLGHLFELTLGFLLHGLFDFFFLIESIIVLDNLNINPLCSFLTTIPIIRTGWKISLHLQVYVLVDLKTWIQTFIRPVHIIGT